MVVKSATKRRLMQKGVDEKYAHLLANDRNLDDIKTLDSNAMAGILSLPIDDSKLLEVVGHIRDLSQSVRPRRKKEVISIETKRPEAPESNLPRFNPLNHDLVPHHELVEEENLGEVLDEWGLNIIEDDGTPRIARELLPKILVTDPVVQVIKETEEAENPELAAGWLTNRVLKVVRKSPSAGISVVYRLVVETS